ncbi:MAG TPA: hypothetical protein VG248_17360 [Caulobacteraceae bacterium]|jgi:hypothetical protein|nr:hypothetical protein [Caulobacteraceae bacterium]
MGAVVPFATILIAGRGAVACEALDERRRLRGLLSIHEDPIPNTNLARETPLGRSTPEDEQSRHASRGGEG